MRRRALPLASMMAVAIGASLFLMASTGRADTITITDIIVKVGDTTWCGKAASVSSAADPCFTGTHLIWDLGATGVVLGAGQSLILTQTNGLNNFDTSENGGGVGGSSGALCNNPNPGTGHCDTTLTVHTTGGGGGVLALSGTSKDNLADNNADSGGVQHNEALDWGASVASFGPSNFDKVYFGYADNLHGDACTDPANAAGNKCLPDSAQAVPLNLFDGTFGSTKSTVFIGQGSLIGKDAGQTQNPSGECVLTSAKSLCYDAGAIMIYNTQPVPEPVTMFLGGTGLLLLGYAARRRLFAQ